MPPDPSRGLTHLMTSEGEEKKQMVSACPTMTMADRNGFPFLKIGDFPGNHMTR
jgi:hypothetical protein